MDLPNDYKFDNLQFKLLKNDTIQASHQKRGYFFEKYKEYSDKAGTSVMHEWAQEDRKQFFKLFIAYYLSYETEIAKNGMPPGD